jgi:broad specificity phosphatase PhoE
MTGHWIVGLLVAGSVAPANLGPPPPGALRLYVVRHAEVNANLNPTPPGMTKDELDTLTPEGQRQAKALAAALGGIDVNAILHSPAPRARATAELIRGTRQVPIREEKQLRRLETGTSAVGKPLELAERVEIWKSGRDPRPPGGESLVDVGERIAALAQQLLHQQSKTGVVLVSHAEVISAFLGQLRGTPGPGRYPPDIPLGSISVVDVTPSGMKEVSAKYVP